MSVISYESFNGYNLQLIKEDGEIWFPAIQVARALGYAEPKAAVYNIISRNPEDFQENTLVTNLVTQGQNRSIRLLNEQGIYVFTMLARTPKSIKFRKWAATIIQLQRKKAVAIIPNVNTITALEGFQRFNEGVLMHLQQQDNRLDLLEETVRIQSIDRHQAYEIKKGVQNIAHIVAELEEREKPSRIHFTKIWTTFNNTFEIPSYKDLPKARFSEAILLLESWKERFEKEIV